MEDIVDRIDAEVHNFAMQTPFFHEPMTPGRARKFVRQHRLNTRQRNSFLKTNSRQKLSSAEHERWGQVFSLSKDQLEFFQLYGPVDI